MVTVSQIPNLEAVTGEAWCLQAPNVSPMLLCYCIQKAAEVQKPHKL